MTIHPFEDDPFTVKTLESPDFHSLGLNENIANNVNELLNRQNGCVIRPSTIQYGSIPLILEQNNLIMTAETGSGKTIAYLAPIIQLIEEYKQNVGAKNDNLHRGDSPFGLVLLPSRELTQQVGQVAQCLAQNTSVGVATMIGGLPKHLQHTGMDLVISTVGIVNSHLNRNIYNLQHLNHIVLDEADTLLDDTFSYEVVDLLENMNVSNSCNVSKLLLNYYFPDQQSISRRNERNPTCLLQCHFTEYS